MIARPQPEEYAEYYGLYINKVPDGDLIQLMEQVNEQTTSLLSSLTEQQALHRYDSGKWSIKEIIQHLIDAERVFQYRALRLARNDQTDLAGYDHDVYVRESNADYRPLADIAEEFGQLRKATIALFKTFGPDVALRSGTANGNRQTVRTIGYVVVGHELHHVQVIKDKYL